MIFNLRDGATIEGRHCGDYGQFDNEGALGFGRDLQGLFCGNQHATGRTTLMETAKYSLSQMSG